MLFLNDWANENSNLSMEQMLFEFQIVHKTIEGAEIILASYLQAYYEGAAYVFFKKDSIYYEVVASHCSCYGLEGQWNPETVMIEELYHRLTKGTFGEGEFRKELKEIVGNLPEARFLHLQEKFKK